MAISPVIIRVPTLRASPDGTLRTTNANGDFNPNPTTLSINVAALTAALGSLLGLLTGATAINFNLRGAWLTGTEAATCTFSVVTITGDNVASKNWAISSANLTQSLVGGSIGSGTLEIFAIDSGGNPLSLGQRTWSIAAPGGGTDSVAPSIPSDVTAGANPAANNSIVVTFAPSTDITSSGGTAPSGVDHYNVKKSNGTVVATVAAQASKLGPGTLMNLGTMSPVPTVVQSGKQFTVTAAGTGIHNTPTEQCLFYAWQLAGAQTLTIKVNGFTSANNFSTAGIMVHETGAQGGTFLAAYLQPSTPGNGVQVKARTVAGGNGSNKATIPTDSLGVPITGPCWIRIDRSTDLATLKVSISTDGKNFTSASTTVLAQTQTIWWGLLLASQTGGTTCTVVMEELSLTNAPALSATFAATGGDTYSVEAVDLIGNISTRYVGAPAIPTAPSVGTRRFRPGHVLELDQGSGGGGIPGWVARIPQARDMGYVGVHLRRPWSAWEDATAGSYTKAQAIADPIMTACANAGIWCSFGFDHGSFGTPLYDGINGHPSAPTPAMAGLPQYFETLNNGSRGYRVAPTGTTWGGLGGIANVDQSYVTVRELALAKFFADNYDSNTAFEFFRFPETAIASGAGISNNGFFAQAGSMCATLKTYFKNSGVMFSPNYSGLDSLMISLFQAMATAGMGGLGPDCLFRNFPSNCVHSGFTGGHDYRTELPCINEMQYATLTRGFPNAGTDPNGGNIGGIVPTALDIYNFAMTGATSAGGGTKPNYMMIFDLRTSPAHKTCMTSPLWAASIPSMPLNTTRPSSYP